MEQMGLRSFLIVGCFGIFFQGAGYGERKLCGVYISLRMP